MKKRQIVWVLLLPMVAACSQIPDGAYFNRGGPESLLQVSSEVVSLHIDSEASVDQLVSWIDKDEPTRAEVRCPNNQAIMCSAAEEALKLYGVDYKTVKGDVLTVDLTYERVLAKDCDNRYLDNHINPYKLNHQAFGCSIASNMVQSVAQKQQFVNPDLLGFRDGKKAVQNIAKYHKAEDNAADDGKKFSVSGVGN
jgi:type IV pilus biogenesis protein CpaD/CtpE